MKNKIIILIVVLLIVTIGIVVGIYLVNKKSSEEGTLLEKTDFSISMPAGWTETTPPAGITLMAVNASEDITGSDAEKINFRTYYSVIYDSLTGRTKEEYIAVSKQSLTEAIPGLTITDEDSDTINAQDVYFMEAEFNQRDIDFKSLLTIISGEEDDIWIISFNTMKSNWKTYKGTFYDISESFKLKPASQ